MNRRMHLLGVLALFCSSMAFGQATNSAQVTGTVTDSSGAVIPGVTVAIKDLDKGQTRTVVTNGAGLYYSGPIVPNDQYTFTFSRDGFQTLQRGPMQLQVGQTGMNIQLTVGSTTQQVVVNETAPLLQTTSAEVSTTLPTQTLATLPQSGNPDWQSFLVLLPGTSGNGGTGSANPGMGSLSANGSMPFSTAMVDGSTISSPMSDNVINTPIFEALGEVQMSDANMSAQYGTGGIVFNQISKGGSNTWHGVGYDYFENNALNAATYGFGFGKVPVLKRNNFGFQVSGPVIKNKIFFLIDWEHRIQHAAGSVSTTTLPTDAMRTGDFTGLPTIYDPTTQVVDPMTGIVTRQSFASEYGNGNKIPAAMLDTVAKNIQAIFPSMPANSFSTNNFTYGNPAAISTLQKWFGRFDADITQKNRLSGSAAYNYPTTFPSSGIVYPVNVTVVDVENESSQLTDVHTFSSHTINEARSGWMGEYDLLKSATDGQGWPNQLGLQFAKTDIFPTINISGYYGLGPGTSANYRENVFTESDVLTMIRGRHALHIGGEMVFYRADSTAWGNKISANMGFTGVYTQQSNTGTAVGGDPYADFLLGYAQNWSALVSPVYYGRLKSPAVFVQDDFKLTPKLTLNLGLRWEGRTGWIDATKNQRSFDATITNPATNTPGAMWYALTATNGRERLQQNQWKNWLPRFGVAYQVNAKTQLNGGVGMYTFPWNVDSYASCCMGNARSSSGSASDATGNKAPVVVLSSDGNTNYQGTAGKSVNDLYVVAPTAPEAYNGQAVSFMQYDTSIPLLYNWNVTVQRQLGSNMMAQIGYVGSHGTNLLYNTDLDQVPESLLGPNDTTTGCNGASCRPYPQYQAISGHHPIATSTYHALQVVFNRRMNNGLTLNANYTWSHMTDSQDSSGWGSQQGTTIWQNAYDTQANWGAANFDVRQMFKAYGTYELPFGRGRRYLANNAALDEAIGGWTMALTFVGQGGHPFTPNMLVNNSYASTNQAGGFKWFPDQVGDPKKSGASGTIQNWFDPAAFQSPAPGTLGNMRRNSVYGPGIHVFNGSIHKTFKIYERVSFELAANATNLFNHASFANPDSVIGGSHHGQITATTVGGRAVTLVGHIRF